MNKLVLWAFAALQAAGSYAQWNTDSTQRNAICTATGYQYEPQSCSDGHGGAIIAWADQRNGGGQDIYVQRIDSTGADRWTANGVRIALPSGSIGVDYPLLVKDNAGGAIVFYQVTVSGGAGNIYAQRLDSNGNILWNSSGVPISTLQDSRIRSNEVAASNNAADDGNGGAYITWQVYSPFNNYIQHIDKDGNVLWGANGESLTQADSVNAGYESFVINTGNGTAVAGYSYYPRLYLQRINANGSFMWGNYGVLVADSFYNNTSNQGAYLVYDSLSSSKSIMLAWNDIRNASNGIDLYAQKLDESGNILWQKNGVPIATSTSPEYAADLLIDGVGGFFITYDSSSTAKIQHVNSSGQLTWSMTGMSIVTGGSQTNPVIVSDGSDGLIAAWHDHRTGSAYGEAIFSQRYNSMGTAYWRANGIPVITKYADVNHSANPLISVGNGKAIVTWSDFRNGTSTNDIYAAEVGGTDGLLPVNYLSFSGVYDKNKVLLKWSTAQELNVEKYLVERSTDGYRFSDISITPSNQITGTVSNYQAYDVSPLRGNNFYRLAEVDVDGRANYSNVIKIFVPGSPVTIFPNPATDFIVIHLNSTISQDATIEIAGADGRVLQARKVGLVPGDNSISFNIEDFPKGMYVVKSKQLNLLQKVIKQ